MVIEKLAFSDWGAQKLRKKNYGREKRLSTTMENVNKIKTK